MDESMRHPETAALLRWLGDVAHLPPRPAEISRQVYEVAESVVAHLPDGPELRAGLAALVQARDWLTRSALVLDRALDGEG